jgi:hypothetical protein
VLNAIAFDLFMPMAWICDRTGSTLAAKASAACASAKWVCLPSSVTGDWRRQFTARKITITSAVNFRSSSPPHIVVLA